LEQLQRADVEPAGQPLDRPEGEVALAALEAAHVGAVDADHLGESFLGEAARLPVGAQIAPDGPLEIPFHDGLERCRLLLVGLQTDK
jgi:hypothetical protein